jgi:phospholipid/cholesterol/gamma-HCH transport system substrate-binding protein
MESSPIRDFIVGLFVLAGLAAIGWLSTHVAGGNYSGPTGLKLHAAFTESGGLKSRSPVVISGVKVGYVTSITLDKQFNARVDMDLDPSLKLPIDTRASIVTAGVLGDRYITLQIVGAEDQILKSGDEITYTEPALILERLISKLIYGATDKNKETGPQTAPQGVETQGDKK